MSERMTIGIFDSGVGGLSVLREVRKAVPHARIVYYADTANCPYGPKGEAFVLERSRAITGELLGMGAELIVIACNTATAASIATLREEMPAVPFVGLEPAVKTASGSTKTGVVGVLATRGTLGGEKYLTAKERFCGSVKVVEHEGCGFVELVESLRLDGPSTEATVRASLQPLLDEGADTIVLGCTHYPFLLPVMQRIAPEGVEFIDPAPAVACRVADLAGPDAGGEGSVEFVSSGSSEALEKLFKLIQ